MACRPDLRFDAARCIGVEPDPQVYQNISDFVEELSVSELKTMFFLLMTDVCDKGSVSNYLQLVGENDYLKLKFLEKWLEQKFGCNDLIESLGVMKKFKHMKNLGMCKHTFKKKQCTYKTIPEICKFFYSVCEELDDQEIRMLRCNIFPMASEDICGEELICMMLLHEKIDCNDFSQLKQSLLILGRMDLISRIETYEGQKRPTSFDLYPIRQPTSQRPSGLAVIINENEFVESYQNVGERLFLEERKGSEIDCRKLESLWQDFGFRVETHIDLTMNEIFRLPTDLQIRDLSSYDIFVLCIMSHGQKGCFYSSDSREIDIDHFVGEFADKCMVSKPKLFFIQACQGNQHNKGIPVCPEVPVQRKLEVDSRPQTEIVPRYADIFQAVATVDNYVSYRDEQDGSLFISHLVKNISEYGNKEDIQAILTRVQNDVSKENAAFDNKLYKQLPVSKSTLLRKVVLKRVQETA